MERSEAERIAVTYRRFAETEARGRSPLYEALALGVAADLEVIAFLLALPRSKRQPNLLLGAVRFLFGKMGGWTDFRCTVLANADAVRAVMLARSTQTNEPGRCAVLLPVLAKMPQPLALLEVGASAGLCLLPDFYGYDYDGHTLLPPHQAAPVFPCAVNPGVPLPPALPQIVWRGGLDLDPVDVDDPNRTAWLRALVWPEPKDRLRRLDAALRIATAQHPRVVRGDLRHDLVELAADMPRDATRVVFHTAVLAYVADREERAEFACAVQDLCDFWIANEAPHVFPGIAARIGAPASGAERDGAGAPVGGGRFLLSVNGDPVAWTDPHGATLTWIADPPAAYTKGP